MVLLALAGLASATVPMPAYPQCGEPDRPDLCPADLAEKWNLLSYVPSGWQGKVRPEEIPLGSGMSVDRAWRTTPGRTDVVIAVIDSGIRWDRESLRRKHWLNAAELPLPEGASAHDANGDGVFNVDDYAADSRVSLTAGVDRADGVLDPSDLIHTFSDGTDADGNGYVDDISGWDFFWNDNDPYDDVDFGHGTGMAEDAAAEGDDATGDIGTCPNCMVLSLRVADSFVADLSPMVPAILYATDSGASVICDALGGISQPSGIPAAIDDAWENGTLMIGSAGDETAWHPNPPGAEAHTFYVHALVYDGDEPEESSSYLAYSNCTNHGARLDGSASSDNCSSGATGVTSGIAGLIVSAARDAGLTLSAGEVHALLAGTVDDVWLPESDDHYPSAEGWDPYFGQGRVHAERAVAAVLAGEIPPVADLTGPDWFEWVDPTTDLPLDVTISATARAGVASWTLEWGSGLSPESWEEVATGAEAGEALYAAWSPREVPGTIPDHPLGYDTVDREAAVNTYTATLRLRVTDTAGRTTESRRAVYVRHDPDLLPGWPLAVSGSLEASPLLVDLDGDGVMDVVQADGDGRVHALRGDGTELAGWPVEVGLCPEADPADPANHRDAPGFSRISPDVRHPITATPAAADLDGDGTVEVVVPTMRGGVWVFEPDGSVRPGFPVYQMDVAMTDPDHVWAEGFLSSPSLADLDGDGALDIVVGGMDQYVYAWTAAGEPVAGWPVKAEYGGIGGARIISSPAVSDLDGDGRDDVVIGSNEIVDDTHGALYAFRGDGSPLPGWPVRTTGFLADVLPVVGEGFPGSAALGDLDGDGQTDIVAHGLAGPATIYALDGTKGEELPAVKSLYGAGSNVSDQAGLPLINAPSLGDLDGDGVVDVLTGATGTGFLLAKESDGQRIAFDHLALGWSGATGDLLPGWPRQMEDILFFQNPAVADIDGDGKMEALFASGGFLLHAWNVDGVEPAGWPKLAGDWIIASPAVGDIDGDGWLDVVIGTRGGRLFAWTTTSPSGAAVAWPMLGRDPRHTRDARAPLDGYNAGYPEDVPTGKDDGCGCGGGAAPGMLGIALALAGLRRRKQA